MKKERPSVGLGRISWGDTPEKIVDKYKGDFNELKNNLNAAIDGLGGLVEGNAILQRMAVNDYTKKVEGKYQGAYADIASSVNDVRNRLLTVVDISKNIAAGNMKGLEALKAIGRRSEKDQLIPSLITMMEHIQGMVNEAAVLTRAAEEGKLDYRGDVSKFEDDYKEVIQGINNTLDAVINPLNMMAEYVDRISKGAIPEKITDDYKAIW